MPDCQYQQEAVRGKLSPWSMCVYVIRNPFKFHTAAVQRKYESVRRQWIMKGKENFDQLSAQMSKNKKYRARRKRVSDF